MSRNFYMRMRVGKTEAVHGRSNLNLKVKLSEVQGFYVFTSGLVYMAVILFTRVKVLCAYAHKIYVTAEIHPKGGCTWSFNLLPGVFFERISISIRNSVKAGVIRTSEAHSCSVPTTGISIASLLDISSLAKRGIPSAFLMACLFLVLLLQLHKASAPLRATSACIADALARDPQSRSAT